RNCQALRRSPPTLTTTPKQSICAFPRAINQRHLNLGALSPPFTPIVAYQCPVNSIAFADQLQTKTHGGDAQLRPSSPLSLRYHLLEPRLPSFPNWPLAPTLGTSDHFNRSRYFVTVLRLNPNSRATRRTLCSSLRTLCRSTCT